MQLKPQEQFAVVRQLSDPFDSGTYYVQAKIRNAHDDTLLATLNLSDKGGQRFRSDWQVPADTSGEGFYIDIETIVYTDSGYSTVSDVYGRENAVYLVQDRATPPFGAGGGPDIDYKRLGNIVRGILKEQEPVKVPRPQKVDLTGTEERILGAVNDVLSAVQGIEVPNHTEAIQRLAQASVDAKNAILGAIDAKPVTEKTDVGPLIEAVRKEGNTIREALAKLFEPISKASATMESVAGKVAESVNGMIQKINKVPFLTIAKPEDMEAEPIPEIEASEPGPVAPPRRRRIPTATRGFVSIALIALIGAAALAGTVVGTIFYTHPQGADTSAPLGDTVSTLPQFTSTTSPSSAITQRTFGKAIKITGLTTGQCLTLNGSGILTTTACGSGGGSGGLASSTPWTAGFVTYVKDNGTLAATATTTLSGNSQVALSNPVSVIGGSASVLSIVADSIGDTQLAFNTGQNLTTASSPTFAGLTLSSPLTVGNGGTGATSLNDLITLGTHTLGNYVATLSSSGSITVSGSGSETAAVTANLNMGNANIWTALQTFTNASTTGYHSFGTASSTNWTGGGLTDCDADNQTVSYDATTQKFGCGDDDTGGGGSSAYEIATTSDIAASQVAYFTQTGGRTTLGSVATGTVSAGTGISLDNTRYVLGGSLQITNSGVTSNVAGDGISVSGATGAVTISNSGKYNISTSSLGISQLVYVSGTSPTSLTSVATGTVSSANTALSVTANRYVVGGALTLTVSTTTTNMFTGTPGQVLAYTGTGWTGVATTTFGTGLTFSGGNVTVNTSQNIATLSNLTGNGAIITSGGVGTLGIYAGTSCTNQFVRSLNGSIAATCATVGAADVSLANLTATDSTLTFSGTYNGSVARTIGLNLSNPNTWSALQIFGNASSTLFSTTYASSTSWFGGGLTSCSNGTTDKVLYNSATGRFSCGTDQGGAGGTPGGSGTELQYRSGASTFGAIADSAYNTAGYLGIGSTTPWALLSVASSTWSSYTRPLFAVATSSFETGQLFTVMATTSNGGTIRRPDLFSGVRVVIGTLRNTLQRLFVNGDFASSWLNYFCDEFNLPVSIIADTNNICGGLDFDEATNATLANAAGLTVDFDTIPARISVASGTTNDGGTLSHGGVIPANFGTTTPRMEVLLSAPEAVSTTTEYNVGFGTAGTNGNAANFSTWGCFFSASTTQNWMAVANNSGTMTIVNTGISTSTSYQRLRVEIAESSCKFFAATSYNSGLTQVANITTNVPTQNVGLTPAFVQVRRITGGTAILPAISIASFRFWKALPHQLLQLQ